MRLKSELWVRAYLRRLEGDGVSAVVVRRGDAEAGAIFISINRLDGTVTLFGPAPAGLTASGEERRFAVIAEGAPLGEEEAKDHLARQMKYDSDIWIVEVEDKAGRSFLGDWLES
jgi:hypothetical protein